MSTMRNVWRAMAVRIGPITGLMMLFLTDRQVLGQCPEQWFAGEGIPGIDDVVYATTLWDPDGPGAQPELLVAGGAFRVAGNVFANSIATWNGESWQSLGMGMNSAVKIVATYNGDLIAGGEFTTADNKPANHIARWDGTHWNPIGTGTNGDVRALTIY